MREYGDKETDKDSSIDEEKTDESIECNETIKEEEFTEEEETNQRIDFKYENIYPEDLKQHEINAVIYGDEEADIKLVENIRARGLIEPLIVNTDNVIISGHRRWRALLHINKEEKGRYVINQKGEVVGEKEFVRRTAKCQKVTFRNKEEERLAIVEYNKRRSKRISQMYNEIEMLHDIFDDEAMRASRANLKQNSDVPSLVRRIEEAIESGEIDEQEIDRNLTPTEMAYEYGHLVGGPTISERMAYDAANRSTNEKIGSILGIGKTNVAKLTEVGRFAREFGDVYALRAMERLDKGKFSINAAHDYVVLRKKVLSRAEPGATYSKGLLQEIDRGFEIIEKKEKGKPLTPYAARKELRQKVPEVAREEAEAKEAVAVHHYPIKYTYSVLYFNFPVMSESELEDISIDDLPDDIKKIYTPAATNAAIFVAANQVNMPYCASYMAVWGFKLRSYIFIEDGKEIVLFGSRGKWQMPESLPDVIQDKNKVHKIIQSIYPKCKSFYEVHTDPKFTQRAEWGMSLESLKVIEEEQQEKANNVDDKKDDEDRDVNPGMAGDGW